MTGSKYAKVLWQEGLLLSPQHLQLFSLQSDSASHQKASASNPFYWGMSALEIDLAALPTGMLTVIHAEGHFESGQGFEWDESLAGGLTLSLALSPEFDRAGTDDLDIYIKKPKGGRLITADDEASFRLASSGPLADQVTNAVPTSVDIGEPNLSLSAGERPSSAYDSLFIGKVLKVNDVFTLAEDLPASVYIPKDGALYQKIGKLLDQLRHKASYLVRGLDGFAASDDSRLEILETRLRLGALLSAITEFNICLAISPMHTVRVFETLARVYTSLSALIIGGLPLGLPNYDHRAPSAALFGLVDKITSVVAAIATAYKFIPFEESHGQFSVEMESESEQRILIGLKGGAEQVLLTWLDGAMIATGNTFESVRSRRVLGATRKRIAPSDLPEELALSGYLIFELGQVGVESDDPTLIIKNAAAQSTAFQPGEIVLIASSQTDGSHAA